MVSCFPQISYGEEIESNYRQLQSGEGNDNATNAAYIKLTNPEALGVKSGIISYKYMTLSNKVDTRFITALNMESGNMYLGIGQDNSSKWFWDNKSLGQYGSIQGLELPEPMTEHAVVIKFDGDVVELTLDGGEAKQVELQGLMEKGSAVAFRAGRYGSADTVIRFRDFRMTDLDGNDLVPLGEDQWEVFSSYAESFTYSTQQTSFSVSGIVSDEDGVSVEGASITLGDKSAITNGDGQFIVTEVQPGEYTLTISKEGYNEVDQVISINDTSSVLDNLVLTKQDVGVESQWRQLQSGSGNDNGNNAAFIQLNNDEAMGLTSGIVTFKYKHITSFDESRAMILAHIGASKDYYGVGHNKGGWFWDTTSSGYGGLGNIPKTESGTEYNVELKFDDDEVTITLDGQYSETKVLPAMAGNTYPIGFRAGSYNSENTTIQFKDFKVTDLEGNTIVAEGADQWIFTDGGGEASFIEEFKPPVMVNVSGRIINEDNEPIGDAQVLLGDQNAVTDELGLYSFQDIVTGDYVITVSADGYKSSHTDITVGDTDLSVDDISLSKPVPVEIDFTHKISSDIMDVAIDLDFPRVMGYKLLNSNKLMVGQLSPINELIINRNISVVPEVTCNVSDNKAVYVMNINNGSANQEATIDAVVTLELSVVDNILSLEITNIDNIIDHSIQSIYIPNHSLVSANSEQSGAKFDGANIKVNVRKSGDTHKSISAMENGIQGYMIAMVTADGLSASMWSNSQSNYGSSNIVTGDWKSITAETSRNNGKVTTGLYSSTWTYELPKTNYRREALPKAKVIIVEDSNGDNKVDWQDSAIGYRSIMNVPLGADRVPDRVAYRIAMNFGSQAANPFLKTLDNVKKVYLSTDGLGQSILLKGYGSEGHDSGHLDYANIGSRIGGAEDMKVLLEKGDAFGADFGIHVNASETYPESQYFTEDRLRKKGSSYAYGWNWIDQGININALYDLNNGRKDRFKDLYDELGGQDNQLDYIYVDVWGNGQSGDNGSWASRQLADEIHSFNWAVGGEWGYAFSNDSIFQHWAADLTYGGYTLKGVNSKIIRFVKNSQRDSWVGDYPSYGGAAVNPLLGGYDMKDFEGWQGRSDYGAYIKNLFADNVPTKFVQHYECTKWIDGNPVILNGETWIPEMEVELAGPDGEVLNIKRQSNDANSSGYHLRTMNLDDSKIMDGNTYLIPWKWDTNGNLLNDMDQKLYHYNENESTTTTTWNLLDSWKNADDLYMYELTQDGKKHEEIIQVVNGSITLTAKSNVPYVIYKSQRSQETVNWSENMHIVDAGFNSGDIQSWNTNGDISSVEVITSQVANRMLKISNPDEYTSVSQTLTDLTPGQQYAAYVGVDNRSEEKAYIKVESEDFSKSNYTVKSIAKNYIKSDAHNTNMPTVDGTSYFQNMNVYFIASESGTVTLTLAREAGAGASYFDDIRVCENQSDMYKDDTTYEQDFEHVVQGIYPFVIGNSENVEDNRIHLAEKNAPYTQQNWNGAGLNDVINGNWSIKVNGLTGRNKIVFRTIPQNYRFENNVVYDISFNYGMGSDGIYALVIGHGDGIIDEIYELDGNIYEEETNYQFQMTGNEQEDSWFGIYSTNIAPDKSTMQGDKDTFCGIGNFVLDDLRIIANK